MFALNVEMLFKKNIKKLMIFTPNVKNNFKNYQLKKFLNKNEKFLNFDF